MSAAGTHRCCCSICRYAGSVHNSERLCAETNMVCDVAPGASSVLIVLLTRIDSKDVYVTPNMRQGLRLTQLNRTYQVYF